MPALRLWAIAIRGCVLVDFGIAVVRLSSLELPWYSWLQCLDGVQMMNGTGNGIPKRIPASAGCPRQNPYVVTKITITFSSGGNLRQD